MSVTINGNGTVDGLSNLTSGNLTVDTNTLYVDSANNRVGIGTSSPTQPLTIYNSTNSAGPINVLGDGNSSTITSTRYSGDAVPPQFATQKARGTFASPTVPNSGDQSGQYTTRAFAGTNFRTITNIISFVDTVVSDTNISGILAFNTNGGSTGTTERMRITSAGNVGIGTSSPAGRLDITQATNGSAFVVNALGGGNPNFIVQGSGEQTFRLYNSAATGSTRTSIKLASRLDTDWEWIVYTDSGGTGTNDLRFYNLAGLALNISSTRIVSDYKGDLRAAPIQSKTSAYVLVATDSGQTISITTGGVTVNASIFSAGDMVSIFNNSGSSQTITQGASVTLRLSGTATTGNRTLAQYGIATLLCVVGGATPTFACTGAGLT